MSSASADLQNGRQVFQDTCAGCHTMAAAGSTATIGPNLDASFAEARSEGFKESTILDIVHDQIKFPGQYPLAQNNPDYLKANMPANLVTGQDAIDVSAYVAANVGKQGFEAQVITGTNGKQIFITKMRRLPHAEGRGDDRDPGTEPRPAETALPNRQEPGDQGRRHHAGVQGRSHRRPDQRRRQVRRSNTPASSAVRHRGLQGARPGAGCPGLIGIEVDEIEEGHVADASAAP